MKCSNDDHPWATSSSGHIDKETAPTISLDLGDGEDKVHDPCIVTKDSPEVTPTMCSMKCSSPDTKPDLTMVAEVTYASAATASMELVTAQKAIGATYSDTSDHTKVMHAKCLTVVLDAIGDTGQAMVVFQTWTDAFKDDPTSVQFMDFFSSSMMANIKWNIPMPTKCLVQCLGHGNMALMPTNPLDVNPWPPPWLDGVIKGRDLRPSPWLGFNFCGTVEHLVPPWPPPTQISYLALLLTDFAILSTEMLLTVRHWARVHLMLPWPPPNNSDSKHTMIQLEHCWSWEIGFTINQSAWKEQWDLVNQRSCIFSEIYGMHELGISYHNLLQVKLFKPKIDKQIRVVLLLLLHVPVERQIHGCFVIFTEGPWRCLHHVHPFSDNGEFGVGGNKEILGWTALTHDTNNKVLLYLELMVVETTERSGIPLTVASHLTRSILYGPHDFDLNAALEYLWDAYTEGVQIIWARTICKKMSQLSCSVQKFKKLKTFWFRGDSKLQLSVSSFSCSAWIELQRFRCMSKLFLWWCMPAQTYELLLEQEQLELGIDDLSWYYISDHLVRKIVSTEMLAKSGVKIVLSCTLELGWSVNAHFRSNAKLLENYIKEIYESAQCGDSTIPFFVQLTWDPGGSGNNLHRLEDKPNVKERGLLATQLCCIWARLAMFQSKPRQAQLATYISSNSKHLGDLGTEERQRRRLASVARRAAAAATWRPVGSLSISFPTSTPSSSPPP